MKTVLKFLAVPVALAAIVGLLLLSDWLRDDPEPSSEPVRRTSVIESWNPPWPAPTASSEPVARKWLVIGWDGASWDLILPLLEAGKMPHLAALMQRGAYGPLATFQPTLSPVLWTTVATGVPPAAHGIRGFDVPKSKVDKRLERLTHWGKLQRHLYNNTDRRVRAIWNLLSDAGRPVLIAGYHNTYPAEEVHGLMVSNYLMQDLMSKWMHASGGVDPELAETLVHPVAELPTVLAIESKVRKGLHDALPRFADLDLAETRAILAGQGLDPETHHRLFFLRQAYLGDTFDAAVAEHYLPLIRPDLAMVHFQAIDLASHYYLYYHEPQAYASLPLTPAARADLDADRAHFTRTVEAFHVYLDEWLGRLVAAVPPDTGIVVLSDHGFGPVADAHRPGGHEDAPPGILVVAGPGIARGARIDGASLYDVFPTLAEALGLPLSRELHGGPIAQAFRPGALDAAAAPPVATYEVGERYVPRVAPPAALGAELERQLKSLGYIK
ncbi:MAG TPA: alkaline phosphatase family protein [Candidatus Polarisedimenticolaceae bacterium]|nr:alkaline phosphatase family protein [Candidatus Polarisedimenticolaceae bacterium]